MSDFFTAESTGRANQNIDEILRDNVAATMKARGERFGTIEAMPDEFPGGLTQDDILNMVTGSYGGAIGATTKAGKGVISKLMKHIDASKLKNLPRKVKRAVTSSKPYQQMRQKFKEWDQPRLSSDDPLSAIISKAKADAATDIGGKRGIDRLFHTLDETKSKFNNPRVRGAIKDAIEERIILSDAARVPKSYRLLNSLKNMIGKGEHIGGRAWVHPPRARIEFAKSGSLDNLRSIGKHEFTHVGQMQPNVASAPWMSNLIKKHKLKGDEMTWLRNNVFSRQINRNPNLIATQRWEDKYMDKIYPHLTPKAQNWYDDYFTGKVPWDKLKGRDKMMEYFLRPRELAARASQMRHYIDELNVTGKTHPALKRMAMQETDLLTDKGLDMTINKLWGLGPLGLAIDKHIDADKDK
tara:strand:- start:49 stop:1281 length:1233 start_codon:yes stop_codon:yes gene_type:complete